MVQMTAVWVAGMLWGQVGWAQEVSFPVAPPLGETTWLLGDPVEVPAEGIAVVELWATWCGPCIDQLPHLQQVTEAYAGKVRVVAISDEDLRTVRNFWQVRQRQEGLPAFSVGTDPSGETSQRYMRIDGARGIPRAYIVQDGAVAWSGHPAMMDGVLEAVVAGRWDATRAAYAPQAATRVKDYFAAVERGQVGEAARIGAEVVRYADTLPGLLNDMAWMILTDVPEVRRDVPLALAAASRAAAIRPEDAAYLDTLGMALYQSRRLEEAVATQTRAVSACTADSRVCDELRARLAGFQAALSAAAPAGR